MPFEHSLIHSLIKYNEALLCTVAAAGDIKVDKKQVPLRDLCCCREKKLKYT